MKTEVLFFLALKFLQAGYKNAKYYLAIVLLFTIAGETKNNSPDNTMNVLIYLCFVSLLLSRVLAWIFLQDFSKIMQAIFMLPLHLTGLVDFLYIFTDTFSPKSHNSIRFYISSILSLFCYPAYIILVILIDSLYQGIDKQIIIVVVLLSSISELFVFCAYGMRTASKISSQNNYYIVLQFMEMLCSLSFLGLIIINIRYSLPFLITYFCIIFVFSFSLPLFTSSFVINGTKLNWFQKTLQLLSFWVCVYQPCLNRVEFRKKNFSGITKLDNKFLVICKFFFYQLAFFFFVGYREEINKEFDETPQIQALFIIACISQLKLIMDVAYTFFLLHYKKSSEIILNELYELNEFINSVLDKKDYSHVKRIAINVSHFDKNESQKILQFCLSLLDHCEIVINNTNNGRFFYDDDQKYQYIKLNEIKNIQFLYFLEFGESSKIAQNIHYLNLNIPVPAKAEEEQVLYFLKLINNSNVIHFDLQYKNESAKGTDLNEKIRDYKSDIMKATMHYLAFRKKVSQFIPINPKLVQFDLYDL